MSKKEAQYRYTECRETLKGASSYVGFLGAERSPIDNPKLGMAIIAAILIGFVAAHTQIG